MNPSRGYETVIGLEVHAQLLTRSKAFCACPTKYGDSPNSNTCPVCLGHPGALPATNREMIDMAIALGLATGCSVRPVSTFARKNYFYPDLPKGYQISQYEDPICHGGSITIELSDGSRKKIGITRIHMEEDAGKSLHDIAVETLIELNRCGVPLLEIVSEPDLRSPAEAHAYLTQLRRILTYLEICDGNMEEGSLRCDANISVRRAGAVEFGTRTELKNLNSFRNVERALRHEVDRHISIIESGGAVVQETLQWDAGRGITTSMRGKEEAHDYRYFPEPDLPPVIVDEDRISRIRSRLPENPLARKDRFMRAYGLSHYDADVLTSEKPLADYFEATAASLGSGDPVTFKAACNWIMGDYLRIMREMKRPLSNPAAPPPALAELLNMIDEGLISGKMAKELFEDTIACGEMPRTLAERSGLVQISDEIMLASLIARILGENMESVRKYHGGRENVLGFFVGQVMKETRGRAHPQIVNDLLKAELERLRDA